jgi:hypothetical protein
MFHYSASSCDSYINFLSQLVMGVHEHNADYAIAEGASIIHAQKMNIMGGAFKEYFKSKKGLMTQVSQQQHKCV